MPPRPRGPGNQRAPIQLLSLLRSGAFARDSHHLKLTMTYDRKNVDFGEVDAGPGKSMASIIYPNDPKRRLEVWWSDVDKRKDFILLRSTVLRPGRVRADSALVSVLRI